jgi:hypothetical protein
MHQRSGPTNWWWDDDKEIIHTALDWIEFEPEQPKDTGLVDHLGRKIVRMPEKNEVEYFGFVPLEEKE